MNRSLDFIDGIEPLTEMYGDCLSFHDAEVLRIELLRGQVDLGEANLDLDLHMFAIEGVAPNDGRFIRGRHCVASFRFESIQDLELAGFNHQNAIMGLNIESIEPPENGAKFLVSIPEAFGVSATFKCFRCSLLGLKPVTSSGKLNA
jgi:hypothetical protein